MANSNREERGFLGLYLVVLGVLAAAIAIFVFLTRHYG
jgi:hypothetical protein